MNKGFLIEAISVSKYYKDGMVVALDKVSMNIAKGDFLAIKGPSGSGKSTLLHLIGGLDSPSHGEIRFEGKRARELYRKNGFRLNHIGFVFQTFYLWPILNVLENILLPSLDSSLKKKESLKKAKELIDIVGLSHKMLSSVNELSVGERQRVAVARALVMDPILLLADEPTGNLDSKNAENILQLFKEINKKKGLTIIMATHAANTATFCNRFTELLDGRVIS